MPNLLNEAVADGTVVPRCFLGEYHSQLNAWDVWNFGFTKKCEGNGENDQWASCTACETEKVKASEGAVIGGTVFKSGLPCNISYLDCVGGHPPCKQRPQTVCAALPNTVRRAAVQNRNAALVQSGHRLTLLSQVGRWLLEHAPLPGGDSQAPACYRGAFRTNGEAIRRRPRERVEKRAQHGWLRATVRAWPPFSSVACPGSHTEAAIGKRTGPCRAQVARRVPASPLPALQVQQPRGVALCGARGSLSLRVLLRESLERCAI